MQTVSSQDVSTKYEEFCAVCKQVLPKVKMSLILDVLEREKTDPNPLYTVEVFTTERVDPQYAREYIIGYTGNSPAIFLRRGCNDW